MGLRPGLVAMVRRGRSRRGIRSLSWPQPTWCRVRIRRGVARFPVSVRFPRLNWSVWRAAPSCSGCCSLERVNRSGMDEASGLPRTRSGVPWWPETVVACSAPRSRPGARPTTSPRGRNRPGAPPISTIWPCSAMPVIADCTTTNACSPAPPMEAGAPHPTPATPTVQRPVANGRTVTGGEPTERPHQWGGRWPVVRGRDQ